MRCAWAGERLVMLAAGVESTSSTESMGDTAENVAERFGVSSEDQDAFALESHRRAVAAAETGRFDPEIVAIDVPQPKARR